MVLSGDNGCKNTTRKKKEPYKRMESVTARTKDDKSIPKNDEKLTYKHGTNG